MVVKRIVDTRFWEDSQVLDNYSVEDKYFLLYLMTNPRSSQVGIYALPKKVISFDTGYTVEVINVLIDRFSNTYKNILYSYDTQEIALLNSLKYSIVKGGKPVSDLLIKELSRINDTGLVISTYHNMINFWTGSDRPFDKTVKQLFEDEIKRRERIHNPEQQRLEEVGKSLEALIVNEISHLTFSYYQNNYGELTPEIRNEYTRWIREFTDEIVLRALQRSGGSNNPFKYSIKILQNWSIKGVKTLDDIEALDRKFAQKYSSSG